MMASLTFASSSSKCRHVSHSVLLDSEQVPLCQVLMATSTTPASGTEAAMIASGMRSQQVDGVSPVCDGERAAPSKRLQQNRRGGDSNRSPPYLSASSSSRRSSHHIGIGVWILTLCFVSLIILTSTFFTYLALFNSSRIAAEAQEDRIAPLTPPGYPSLEFKISSNKSGFNSMLANLRQQRLSSYSSSPTSIRMTFPPIRLSQQRASIEVPPFIIPSSSSSSLSCNPPAAPDLAQESAIRITFTSPIDDVVLAGDDPEHLRRAALEDIARVILFHGEDEADVGSSTSSRYRTWFENKNAVFETISTARSTTVGCTGLAAKKKLCKIQAIVEPFLMDVVYTYVNPNTSSHRHAVDAQCGKKQKSSSIQDCKEGRFRDWNELLFSMRSVYERGMCTNDAASGSAKRCGEVIPDRGAFVRRVFVVVGNHDQVPEWLVQDSHVTIVTHEELFASEADKLPTLNSHAIESVLHRIPGLSKYFVYFNNDMFWGRRVSFLDYFRPLSLERTALRESRYVFQQYDKPKPIPPPPPVDDDAVMKRRSNNRTISLWFEPILFFERPEDPRECILHPPRTTKHSNKIQQQQNIVAHAATHTRRSSSSLVTSHFASSCRWMPLLSGSLASMKCRSGPSPGDPWSRFTNYNKQLIFERIAGGWPSHTFAHYPRVMDREILHQMLERDFADVARATRSQGKRSTSSLWTTYVYQYYALGVRRDIDSALVLDKNGWQRPILADGDDKDLFAHAAEEQSSSVSIMKNVFRKVAPLASMNNGRMLAALGGVSTSISQSQSRLAPLLAVEKLDHDVVSFDQRGGSAYHFCMIRDWLSFAKYQQELQNKMKLFVTLNDDIEGLSTATERGNMRRLILLIVGGSAHPAPWERQNFTID